MLCHGVVTIDRSIMTSTDVPVTEDGRASGQAGQVEHPTMAERAARGKAARKLVPLSVHGEWQPSSDRPGPRSPPRGAGRKSGAGAGPDPLRPNVGVAVHLLPRCRLLDGLRPGERATHRPVGTTVRRRASVQLRCLRRPGPAARLQRQRLRRDVARPVRVGRQEVGGQLRRRRTRSWLRHQGAQGDQPGHGPVLSRGDAGLGADEEARRLVFPSQR